MFEILNGLALHDLFACSIKQIDISFGGKEGHGNG